MSYEDIRHIYCDGEKCCESIDGYNPHAKNIDNFIIDDLKKQGWVVVEEEEGETKHFCPNCKHTLEEVENPK